MSLSAVPSQFRSLDFAFPSMGRWLLAMAVSAVHFLTLGAASAEEDVQIWEYAPYRVQIWIAFEPSVVESDQARNWLKESAQRDIGRAFRATWDYKLSSLPDSLRRNLAGNGNMGTLSISDLARKELALAVSTTHAAGRNLRTFQAACDSLGSIAASASTRAQLLENFSAVDLDDPSGSKKLLDKLSAGTDSDSEILKALSEAAIPAAVLPKQVVENRQGLRLLPCPLPWQTDWWLNHLDKVFFVSIGIAQDQYRLRVFEVDCPMQFVGPPLETTGNSWSDIARSASSQIAKAFAPVARVEGAEATTAQLRGRALGLITEEDLGNPSRLRAGDVLQPIIRRDDRSGVPTLLQPLDFTFAAITEADGAMLKSNVYTYSGGPGLRGRQNPRTHRILLRVRPQRPAGDLRVVVRGDEENAQAGCAIYTKDHLTDEFTYLGRTDWRGQLALPAAREPVEVLPSGIKSERELASKKSRETFLAQARQAHDELVNKAIAAGEDPPKFVPPVWRDSRPPIDPANLIKLSAPLIQIYVKSGNAVLARLPVVPGLKAVEIAELPSDQLRLHAEALVRGFQGEILDLIGQRNLLAARVRLFVQRQNLERAEKDLEQLRSLKDFNQMNDELSGIQRSILEQADNNLSRASQSQIDIMFKSTRDLLQKYMQDDVVSTAIRLVREARPAE